MAVEFVDEAANVEIRDGIVFFIWPDRKMGIPLRVCRVALARANKALLEYDARMAEIVPMRRRGRKA